MKSLALESINFANFGSTDRLKPIAQGTLGPDSKIDRRCILINFANFGFCNQVLRMAETLGAITFAAFDSKIDAVSILGRAYQFWVSSPGHRSPETNGSSTFERLASKIDRVLPDLCSPDMLTK